MIRLLVVVIFIAFLSPPSSTALSIRTMSNNSSKAVYKRLERGSPNSLDYRLYIEGDNGPISSFHDIPLMADKAKKIYNMVVEIPRWSNTKIEMATREPLNPIKQDVKKGMLRYVANVFPYHGYIWNYGAMPQTWEDPSHIDESTGCKGDNDPIDVCEIGFRVAKPGDILQVKVLGTFALVDEGETDWKILVIDVNDPMAEKLNDIEDVDKYMPGFLKATHEWFKIYKVPNGKPANKFAFDGQPKNREFAENIIESTHQYWKKLINSTKNKSGLECSTVTNDESSFKITQSEANAIFKMSPELGPAAPIDPKVDTWHFVTLK